MVPHALHFSRRFIHKLQNYLLRFAFKKDTVLLSEEFAWIEIVVKYKLLNNQKMDQSKCVNIYQN
jgi:hypothetical protein